MRLQFVPSHIGIQGNERADVWAKAALDKTKQFYYIPYTDFKYNISVYLDHFLQGSSMSPTSCSRYNQLLSDLFHQWNAEEMTLSYAGPELAMPISQTGIY